MKLFTIDEPVFKTATLFVIGCDFQKFHAYMLKRWRFDAGDDGGQIGQMFTMHTQPHRVVWCKKPDPVVAVHEIFHLVTRICQDRGVRIVSHDEAGHTSDEAAAFLMEFFCRIALRKIQ